MRRGRSKTPSISTCVLGRMAATGLLLGSVGHGWYKFLDHRLPGTDRGTVAKKVGYDLFAAGPVFAWIFFWGELCFVNHHFCAREPYISPQMVHQSFLPQSDHTMSILPAMEIKLFTGQLLCSSGHSNVVEVADLCLDWGREVGGRCALKKTFWNFRSADTFSSFSKAGRRSNFVALRR